jgi:hypothetical protein
VHKSSKFQQDGTSDFIDCFTEARLLNAQRRKILTRLSVKAHRTSPLSLDEVSSFSMLCAYIT